MDSEQFSEYYLNYKFAPLNKNFGAAASLAENGVESSDVCGFTCKIFRTAFCKNREPELRVYIDEKLLDGEKNITYSFGDNEYKDRLSEDNSFKLTDMKADRCDYSVEGRLKVNNLEYAFAVICREREKILYSISEDKDGGKRKVTVTADCSSAAEGIKLVLCSGNGEDVYPVNRATGSGIKDVKGNAAEIDLKKNFTASFTISDEVKGRFRLFFKNEEDEKYFLLTDISEIAGEGTNDLKGKYKRWYDDEDNKVMRCPYCYGEIKFPKRRKKFTAIDLCGGNKDIKFRAEEYKKLHRKGKSLFYCGKKVNDERFKNLIIPSNYGERLSERIAFIGESNSGKSVLLSALIDYEGTLSKNAQRLTDIVEKFAGRGENANLIGIERFDGETLTVNRDIIEGERSTNPNAYSNLIPDNYSLTVGNGLPSSTSVTQVDLLQHQPFVYSLGKTGYAYFYDVAGEGVIENDGQGNKTVNKERLNKLHSVKGCTGAVLLISPRADAGDRSGVNLGEKLDAAMDIIDNLLTIVENLNGTAIPVAVVFAQFDRYAEFFDNNCYIRKTNLKDVDFSGLYRNSSLEYHINRASYELENFIKIKRSGIYTRLRKFLYYKCFAVSSIGSSDCIGIDENDGKQQILRHKENPYGLELPLIWLMYQNGLIKR